MRIQLEIPPAMKDKLIQWKDAAGFKSYSELFNNAMSVFTWVGTEVRSGRIVVSLDPQKGGMEKQLSMPFMDALAPNPLSAEETAPSAAPPAYRAAGGSASSGD